MAYGYTHLPKNMADEGGPTSLHDQVGTKSGGGTTRQLCPPLDKNLNSTFAKSTVRKPYS